MCATPCPESKRLVRKRTHKWIDSSVKHQSSSLVKEKERIWTSENAWLSYQMSQSSSDPSWQNTKNSESYCEPFTARQYLPVREFHALISIFCSWQNLIDRTTKSVFQGKASRRRGRVRRSLRHRLVGLPGLAFGVAISFAEWPFSRQAEKILRDLDCEAFAPPFSSGRN